MSADEIVFDEVAYREPRRMRRPDRDERWATIAYRVPGPDDLPIFLDRRPADAIERHSLRDTSVELGGILLGAECVDDETGEPFVWITEALEAKHYENTQASFTYTHDSWEEITRERDAKFPDLDIVGWYHTHPDFGIFLSGHDLFIHHNFFSQPLQVAYVVDPLRQDRGFFRWRDGQMEQVEGFYLSAERPARLELARFVNELENLPVADSSGGGLASLSPRLEAELIAMLSRPHTTVAAADRPQVAAAFGLLGTLFGALAVAMLFWLQSISHAVQSQATAFEKMESAVNRATASRDIELDAQRVAAKEAVLDDLLGELQIGTKPEKFVSIHLKTAQERDEARKTAAKLAVETEAMKEFSTRLKEQTKETAEKLVLVRKDLEASQKELATYKAKVAESEGETEAETKLGVPSVADVLRRKYEVAWFTAAGGWGVCALLGLALLATLARGTPPEEPATREETHTIQ